MTQMFQQIPIAALRDSKTNPRRHFPELRKAGRRIHQIPGFEKVEDELR